MDAIVQALIIWISANSGYSTDDVASPTVVFMSPQEITAEYYSDHPELTPTGGIDDRIWALYDATADPAGTVYLRVDQLKISAKARETVTPGRSDSHLRRATPASLVIRQEKPDKSARLFEDNPILTERLLHELVHHVQFQSGESQKFPCTAFGEKEAYLLGGRYFKQRHIEDPMPNRNFWAHVYSRC